MFSGPTRTKDEALRDKLAEHFAVLRRKGLIAEWCDRKIDAETPWQEEIDRHLLEADVVLLLVSASFINSDYCWGNEMDKALARHRENKARVVPVILHPCRWELTPLVELQAVPKDGKPISEWANEHAACDDVVSKIARVVIELRRAEEARRKAEEERQLAEACRRPEEQEEVEQEEARPKAEEPRRAEKNAQREAEKERERDQPTITEPLAPASEQNRPTTMRMEQLTAHERTRPAAHVHSKRPRLPRRSASKASPPSRDTQSQRPNAGTSSFSCPFCNTGWIFSGGQFHRCTCGH